MSPVAERAVTAARAGPAQGTKTRPRLAPRRRPFESVLARRLVRNRNGGSSIPAILGKSNVAASRSSIAIARSRRKSSGRPSASSSDAPATVKIVKLPTSPRMITYGGRPEAPPASRIGSTGRTQGEIAVMRPATNAIPSRISMHSGYEPRRYGKLKSAPVRLRPAREEPCAATPIRACHDYTLGQVLPEEARRVGRPDEGPIVRRRADTKPAAAVGSDRPDTPRIRAVRPLSREIGKGAAVRGPRWPR